MPTADEFRTVFLAARAQDEMSSVPLKKSFHAKAALYRPRRCLVAAALIASPFFGCSGSSGGGPPPVTNTVLARVLFVGSSSVDTTPDPGDRVILAFNGQVNLAGQLQASDLSLSDGNLGDPLAAPTLLTSTSIQIVLGPGTTFTPGTTTLAINGEQRVITDSVGAPVPGSAGKTIMIGDGDNPTIASLTLSGIPTELNGEGPKGGTLQVARTGFTIDASYSDATSAIDPTSIVLYADKQVGQIPAGANLLGGLSGTPGATSMSLTVPGSFPFPDGDITLKLGLSDISGMAATPRSFAFKVRFLSNDVDPFEAGQTWYLDLSRDVEEITSSGSGTITLSVTPGANGTADFTELLTVYGLRSNDPIANVSGAKDSNEVVLQLLQQEILADLDAIYAGTGVVFTFTAPGTFPPKVKVLAYSGSGFSQISIAGAPSLANALGLAYFDPHNTTHENNTLVPPDESNRLGVFCYTIADGAINLSGTYFRSTFDPILKGRGTPIGEEKTNDKARLQAMLVGTTTGDQRHIDIWTAISRFARLIAVATGHECGHSMGLVEDDRQPAGLYGGLDNQGKVIFPGSTSGHLDLSSTSVFPFGAQEIMSPGIAFDTANHPSTAFNPLLRGYLLRQVIYNNNN